MASVSTNKKTGERKIHFTDPQGTRQTLRLGKTTQKGADAICVKIEHLKNAADTGTPLSDEVAHWVAGLSDTFHAKLARYGLCRSRERQKRDVTLGYALKEWAGSRPDLAPGTQTNMVIVKDRFLHHFPETLLLSLLVEEPGRLDKWLVTLRERYALATVNKTIKMAKAFFTYAVRLKWLTSNPMADTKAGKMTNAEHMRFISIEDATKLIEVLPDIEWKLLVALARFAGLRVPSEAFRLRWQDVLWDSNRIHVTSTKTKRYDKGERIIPIFAALRPYLEEAWDQAKEGAVYVIERHRKQKNMGTQLKRYMTQAGLKKWPRPWRNLRSSLATDLAGANPGYVCEAWLGHTESIANAHYRQVLEKHFAQAAGIVTQNPTHHGATPTTMEDQETEQAPTHSGPVQEDMAWYGSVRSKPVTPRRFELRLRD